jgi:CBS domain-containing protein
VEGALAAGAARREHSGMYTTVPLKAAPGLDRPVLDVMHAGHVTIPGRLPLAEAARLMGARRVHALLVCDDRGAPLGWVTAHGMLHNLPRDWDGASVREAITEKLVDVAPEATVRDALDAFLASGASHILVRRPGDDLVCGVVAESDLLELLAARAA